MILLKHFKSDFLISKLLFMAVSLILV